MQFFLSTFQKVTNLKPIRNSYFQKYFIYKVCFFKFEVYLQIENYIKLGFEYG